MQEVVLEKYKYKLQNDLLSKIGLEITCVVKMTRIKVTNIRSFRKTYYITKVGDFNIIDEGMLHNLKLRDTDIIKDSDNKIDFEKYKLENNIEIEEINDDTVAIHLNSITIFVDHGGLIEHNIIMKIRFLNDKRIHEYYKISDNEYHVILKDFYDIGIFTKTYIVNDNSIKLMQ